MKRYMYLLSLISTAILSYLFISRNNWLAAAFAIAAFLFYAWGLLSEIRRARTGKSKQAGPEQSSSPDSGYNEKASSETALQELRMLLAKYNRQMRIFRNASVTLALMAAVLGFVNESLAIAILIIAMVALFKFWQNYRAVRLIRNGAGKLLETNRINDKS